MLVVGLLLLPVGAMVRVNPTDTKNESPVSTKISTTQTQKWPTAPWSEWRASMQSGFFIRTIYNGVEKETPVLQSIFSGINVDNNPDTGVDGNDVKVSIIVLPLLQDTDIGTVLSIHLAIKIIRLDDEIKDGALEICLSGSINYNGQHRFRLGYYSPEGDEIPREIREVVTIVPYFLYDNDPEFYLNIEPVFDSANQNLSVVLDYEQAITGSHQIMLDFFPCVDTLIKVTPHTQIGKTNISLSRVADMEQTIRLRYEGLFSVNVTVDDIPQEMAFALGFGDNFFEYDASDEFNATLIVELAEMAYLLRVEYLPHQFIVQYGANGYFTLSTNERKTTFIFANALENPTSYFLLTNLSGEAIVKWQVGLTGLIEVSGFAGLFAEAKSELAGVYFKSEWEMQADYFLITWDISVPGSVSIDTNGDPLSHFTFNLSVNSLMGAYIATYGLRAIDWQVSWQTEIPFFSRTGTFEFGQLERFDIMLNGIWYHVF